MNKVNFDDYLWGKDPIQGSKLLVYIAGITTGCFVILFWLFDQVNWPWWQMMVVALVATDIGSGVVANFLATTRKFYQDEVLENEPGWSRFIRSPMGFTSIHIYPILVWLILTPEMWWVGLVWYGLILGCVALLVSVPKKLFLAIVGFLLIVVFLVNAYLLPYPDTLSWFIPLLFIKLTLGHLMPVDYSN